MSLQSLAPGLQALVTNGTLFAWLYVGVPGPKLYAFSQLPYVYHCVQGDWHRVLKELHDQYGPAVRFTYNDVSFITADAFRTIYSHKRPRQKTFNKFLLHEGGADEVQHIISADKESHKRMRRLLSHAFSEKALRNQEDVLSLYVDKFIDKLTEGAQKGAGVDIVKWFNFATFDLIGDLAFGQSFGCLDSGGYHPWVRMVFQWVNLYVYKQAAARLGIDRLAELFAPSHIKKGAKEHHDLSEQTTMRRLESKNTEREDFMSYILRHNEGEGGMSVPEIVENSIIPILAGSETTATLLSGTTFQLLTNPSVYDKLVAEIRSSFDKESDITVEAVSRLPYLLAVFNEGLRTYPPVPTSLVRVSPSGGDFVDGLWIPENTLVSVPHWAAFQSARNFRNPEAFTPERWLGDPEYDSDVKEVLQPFSMGPRNCIGKNLAYAEMRLLLVRLLWKFDLEIMPESKEWIKQNVYILYEKGALNVKLTEVIREKK